ncbi:hypothetical protein BB561_006716 [Smittium simulii]|uniref:Uncharacterized protein n=1 Tax=Smittium simulii TaxID=133385 RepID=A0A2T9Y264_9FUNG|nr:hypothetical protein BB561_006716 [Smittium simulii]
MKITHSISAAVAVLSSFTAIYGVNYLSGKANQLGQLNAALSAAGLRGIRCMPGYIGLDCPINDVASASKMSCFLKGKPGKNQGAVFMYEDPNNTAPGSLRAMCPLIVDIQKCMNKCVDDALA